MSDSLEDRILRFQDNARRLEAEVGKVIVGHKAALTELLVALFAGGHVLLQGVPGLGKTLLVKTVAGCLSLTFGRIQCTPDLMPADILGTTVLHENPEGGREFRFEQGPVFRNVLLADEINRSTPKTQSALLEAMQEASVTAGGETHSLPEPFLLLATQNPIEMEGTYPLPEAQLDRFFFMVLLGRPGVEEITSVIRRTTGPETPSAEVVLPAEAVLEARRLVRRVALPDPVAEYVARIVNATHPDEDAAPECVSRFVRYGASPRGAQAIALAARVGALLDGRANVSFLDVGRYAPAALRHRLILNFEGEAEAVAPDELIEAVISEVPAPRD